jgi:hypothetical protein
MGDRRQWATGDRVRLLHLDYLGQLRCQAFVLACPIYCQFYSIFSAPSVPRRCNLRALLHSKA